jgi:hypothetical protein
MPISLLKGIIRLVSKDLEKKLFEAILNITAKASIPDHF